MPLLGVSFHLLVRESSGGIVRPVAYGVGRRRITDRHRLVGRNRRGESQRYLAVAHRNCGDTPHLATCGHREVAGRRFRVAVESLAIGQR